MKGFSGPALAWSTILIAVGWIAAALFVFGGGTPPGDNGEFQLYGLAVAAFVPAGIAASRASGKLAVPELFAATCTVLLGALLYGALGVTTNPLASPQMDTEINAMRMMAIAPGSAYLGPLWMRDVAAIAGFGFVQAVTMSSIVYMFSGSKRFDASTGVELFISARYLSAKRRDARVSVTAAIAALGVCLGVAALIAVISAMSGYQAEVRDKILNTNAHMILQRWGNEFTDYEEIRDKIKDVPGVVATTPFVYTGGMLVIPDVDRRKPTGEVNTESGRTTFSVLIKGIDADQAGSVSGLREQLKNVDIGVLKTKPGEIPNVIVGKELAKNLALQVGDTISLVTPLGKEGQRGSSPKSMPFRLAGEFSSGMNEFDNKLVYVSVEAAQEFTGVAKAVSGIEIRVNDVDKLPLISRRVLAKVGGWPFRAVDYMQLNAGIFSALKMQKSMMVLILVFIIIVAAFNIASTLFMLVVEKTREVAVLKAIGAKDGMIMKIFVIEGHLIGAVGVISGVLLGLVLCWVLSHLRIHIAADVYLVDTLRVVVNPWEVLGIVLAAFEVAHLATLYPALRAARTYPVEAMRYG